MKIDKEIPVPMKMQHRSQHSSVLRSMDVGDSVGKLDKRAVLGIRLAAYRLKMTVTARQELDGSFRLWRIA